MNEKDKKILLSAKEAENRLKISQASASERLMPNLLRSFQLSDPIADIVKKMQPPENILYDVRTLSSIKDGLRLLDDSARAQKFYKDFMGDIDHIQGLSKVLKAQHDSLEKVVKQLTLTNDTKLNFLQFEKATFAWNAAALGIAKKVKEIDLWAKRQTLSTRLFEAPNVFTSFVKHTSDLLASNPAPHIATRLKGSLNLAEFQLLNISDTICKYVAVPDDHEEPEKRRVLNTPFVQQNELVDFKDFKDEDDIEAMSFASMSAQIEQNAHRVIELVVLCNEASKISDNGIEIFKPTTRLISVVNDLPWITSTDRSRFADVIDCLYFIFYEGAGKDNLRFLDKNGGPLSDQECDLIWCIKQLRNKWARHDPDHGDERSINKSWSDLAMQFNWLGLKKCPNKQRHFQQLHNQLLLLAINFLELILSKLSLKK